MSDIRYGGNCKNCIPDALMGLYVYCIAVNKLRQCTENCSDWQPKSEPEVSEYEEKLKIRAKIREYCGTEGDYREITIIIGNRAFHTTSCVDKMSVEEAEEIARRINSNQIK